MKQENIEQRISKLVAEQLGWQESDINPGKQLVGDLGADSLDIIEIVMAVEEEFAIDIDDAVCERFSTVADVISHVTERVG